MHRWFPVLACAALLCAALPASAAAATLTQLPGTTGCLGATADGGCQAIPALAAVGPPAISPDGRFAYMGSSDFLSGFSRDGSGALALLSGASACFPADDSGLHGPPPAACKAPDFAQPGDEAVFGPGAGAPLLLRSFDTLASAPRDGATGALAASTSCLGDRPCTRIRGFVRGSNDGGVIGPALTARGGIYVATRGYEVGNSPSSGVLDTHEVTGALAALRVDAGGRLRQLPGRAGCFNGAGRSCTRVRGFHDVFDTAASPDGRSIYVVSLVHRTKRVKGGILDTTSPAIAVFARNPTSGRLHQLHGRAGCLSPDRRDRSCTHLAAPGDVDHVVVAPDGRTVYLLSDTSSRLDVLARGTHTGRLRRPAGKAACLSASSGSCLRAPWLRHPAGLAFAPDGRTAYLSTWSPAKTSYAAVLAVRRHPASGSLAFTPGTDVCVADRASAGCGLLRRAAGDVGVGDDLLALRVSPDGRSVYAASEHALMTLTTAAPATRAVAAASTRRRCRSLARRWSCTRPRASGRSSTTRRSPPSRAPRSA